VYSKIIIYGDSFSNHRGCAATLEQMWYANTLRHFPDATVIYRTQDSKSPDQMFLEAANDAVSNKDKILCMIAIGVFNRVSVYRGNGDEKTLDDCEKCFARLDISRETVDLFHPALVWGKLYWQIGSTAALIKQHGHDCIFLHMTADPAVIKEHTNPMVRVMKERVETSNFYISETHSAKHVCEQAQIKPADFALYQWHGHHGPEGQKYFGDYIEKHIMERLQSQWN